METYHCNGNLPQTRRDKFRDTILLESADHNVNNNSFSYIAINAIAGVEIKNAKKWK